MSRVWGDGGQGMGIRGCNYTGRDVSKEKRESNKDSQPMETDIAQPEFRSLLEECSQ
jgi:hypothetical protein